MELKVKKKERIDFFIKRFKLKIEKAGIISKLKLKSKGYRKPSLIKRDKYFEKLKKIQKSIRTKNYFKKLY
ncbi:hypothetical protein NDNC_0010 [Candidatus Nasuia deltocephalinicola]|uniref:Small ribosomal subunit protein bS21 n=1 Tax=Candidatus Nasuia deltocephalincola TaxID=1160784 RepID=A0A974WKK7_9PROT|nr:30S ribosomal protein S21 [Candidatus Nasuia deltocephalinicola]WKD87102.1 30S ribosomal protein S21 [Candidatus Nasuia deltocephalinicola]WKD87114.1 30S ribosomal protein S21 [Candidatus Nasuia deltocephalinicola]BEH03835.1 hypothetical protein NDNC_0010 [Candidatus Nasuia deltocephalinicola]